MLLKKKAPKSWAVFNKWKSLDCALPCCKVYHCREGITQEEGGGVSSYVPGYIIWYLKSKAWLRVFCCDTNNWLQRNLCYLSRYQDTKCHFFYKFIWCYEGYTTNSPSCREWSEKKRRKVAQWKLGEGKMVDPQFLCNPFFPLTFISIPHSTN